jgi:hypothetical protein
MKLYILKAREETNMWEPWYDKTFSVVVRAANETQARELAQSAAGTEGRDYGSENETKVWLDPAFTTCDLLTHKGEPQVVIENHRSA